MHIEFNKSQTNQLNIQVCITFARINRWYQLCVKLYPISIDFSPTVLNIFYACYAGRGNKSIMRDRLCCCRLLPLTNRSWSRYQLFQSNALFIVAHLMIPLSLLLLSLFLFLLFSLPLIVMTTNPMTTVASVFHTKMNSMKITTSKLMPLNPPPLPPRARNYWSC